MSGVRQCDCSIYFCTTRGPLFFLRVHLDLLTCAIHNVRMARLFLSSHIALRYTGQGSTRSRSPGGFGRAFFPKGCCHVCGGSSQPTALERRLARQGRFNPCREGTVNFVDSRNVNKCLLMGCTDPPPPLLGDRCTPSMPSHCRTLLWNLC